MTQPLTKLPDDIDLPSNLSIRNISTVCALLRAAFERGVSFNISIPENADVDLSFLQLAEAARLHAEAVSITLKLSRPADAMLLSVLERSGLLSGVTSGLREFWLHEKEMA